jgi:hypothetical protein
VYKHQGEGGTLVFPGMDTCRTTPGGGIPGYAGDRSRSCSRPHQGWRHP